jgi:signal peptidase I
MIITASYYLFLVIALALTGLIAFLDSDYSEKNYSVGVRKQGHFILLILLLATIIYLCYENFPATLTILVFATGIILLLNKLFLKKRRGARPVGTLVHNSQEFFAVLLIVWVIRSFIIQPYHVPSGSLEPTIVPGDFIAVKQYSYGLHFPIANWKFFKTGEPKRGDIVLFYSPADPTVVFIKRLIGLPGDHIQYKNKVLTINGLMATQTYLDQANDTEPGRDPIPVLRLLENLNGVQHQIYVQPMGGETDDFDFIVPAGNYFMMGDNRDNSDDSRSGFGTGVLGFVPEQNLIGKAFLIFVSWDSDNHRILWNRVGTKIQ